MPHLPVGGHHTRDVVFSPDGKTMYVSVGSGSNVADGHGRSSSGGELQSLAVQITRSARPGATKPSAPMSWPSIRDGKNERIFATGIRNCVGMAVDAVERHAVVLDQRARRPRR